MYRLRVRVAQNSKITPAVNVVKILPGISTAISVQ